MVWVIGGMERKFDPMTLFGLKTCSFNGLAEVQRISQAKLPSSSHNMRKKGTVKSWHKCTWTRIIIIIIIIIIFIIDHFIISPGLDLEVLPSETRFQRSTQCQYIIRLLYKVICIIRLEWSLWSAMSYHDHDQRNFVCFESHLLNYSIPSEMLVLFIHWI